MTGQSSQGEPQAGEIEQAQQPHRPARPAAQATISVIALSPIPDLFFQPSPGGWRNRASDPRPAASRSRNAGRASSGRTTAPAAHPGRPAAPPSSRRCRTGPGRTRRWVGPPRAPAICAMPCAPPVPAGDPAESDRLAPSVLPSFRAGEGSGSWRLSHRRPSPSAETAESSPLPVGPGALRAIFLLFVQLAELGFHHLPQPAQIILPAPPAAPQSILQRHTWSARPDRLPETVPDPRSW